MRKICNEKASKFAEQLCKIVLFIVSLHVKFEQQKDQEQILTKALALVDLKCSKLSLHKGEKEAHRNIIV